MQNCNFFSPYSSEGSVRIETAQAVCHLGQQFPHSWVGLYGKGAHGGWLGPSTTLFP